jgi:hypothetical protein
MTSPEGEITADDLLDTLATVDGLETFLRLPPEAQASFAGWIGKARDDESHWRRINALALAIRMGAFRAEGTPPSAQAG